VTESPSQYTFETFPSNSFVAKGASTINQQSLSLVSTTTSPYTAGIIRFSNSILLSKPTTFSISFNFKMSPGSEGFVFSIGKTFGLGGSSGALGYSGKDSIGVKFDTTQSPGELHNNYVGFLKNGEPGNLIASFEEVNRFDQNEIWYVWIDYDGSGLYLRYSKLNERPLEAILYTHLNLTYLANENVYYQFSSATGSISSLVEILPPLNFANTAETFDGGCSPGEYYNFVTGTCSKCSSDSYNPGNSPCCLNCPSGLVSTEDRTSCTGKIFFFILIFIFVFVFFFCFFFFFLETSK